MDIATVYTELREKGLTNLYNDNWNYTPKSEFSNFFDLNQCPFYGSSHPEKTIKAIETLHKYDYHGGILELATKRTALGKNYISWSRSYSLNDKDYITLREFLEENRHDTSRFSSR